MADPDAERAEIIDAIACDARQWVSFTDGDGDTWQFDLSFLISNWSCVYGEGCLGIDSAPDLESEIGCCLHGAHFVDDDDHADTRRAAERLTSSQWQRRPDDLDDAFVGTEVTAAPDGTCIFHNRPGFSGGSGCALHIGAAAAGERPLDWKPDVCWQVPLRLDEHVDDNGYRTWMVRGWERRDWGVGGAEFHWWCTDDPTAFVGHQPVYESLRDELIELVGQDAYAILLRHLETLELGRVVPYPGAISVELTPRR